MPFLPGLLVVSGGLISFRYLTVIELYGVYAVMVATRDAGTRKSTSISALLAMCGSNTLDIDCIDLYNGQKTINLRSGTCKPMSTAIVATMRESCTGELLLSALKDCLKWKKLQISLSFMTQGMGAGGGCAPSCVERRKLKHTCIFKSEFSKTHLSNTLVVDHDRSKKM